MPKFTHKSVCMPFPDGHCQQTGSLLPIQLLLLPFFIKKNVLQKSVISICAIPWKILWLTSIRILIHFFAARQNQLNSTMFCWVLGMTIVKTWSVSWGRLFCWNWVLRPVFLIWSSNQSLTKRPAEIEFFYACHLNGFVHGFLRSSKFKMVHLGMRPLEEKFDESFLGSILGKVKNWICLKIIIVDNYAHGCFTNSSILCLRCTSRSTKMDDQMNERRNFHSNTSNPSSWIASSMIFANHRCSTELNQTFKKKSLKIYRPDSRKWCIQTETQSTHCHRL